MEELAPDVELTIAIETVAGTVAVLEKLEEELSLDPRYYALVASLERALQHMEKAAEGLDAKKQVSR